ncbi:MAG: hypothetical protein V9F04_12480 [Dermatophilaceae bacterium]
MTDILYRWPEAAKFGRRVPKEKFYEHGAVSTARSREVHRRSPTHHLGLQTR